MGMIVIMSIFFYLFDEKNVQVQPHLSVIYENMHRLKKRYPHFINDSYRVQKENGIFIIEDFLSQPYFHYLKKQFDDKTYESKNVVFRKGSGIDFFNLHTNKEYDGILELFYSNDLLDSLSNIVKKPVQRVPLSDANACSLLLYSKKGDHIDWHTDFATLYGDRFVCLITLVNENAGKTGLSQNEFIYKVNGKEHTLKMKPNTLVIFKGSEILHKSTSIGENEKRILLSMVFCDVCQEKKNIVSYVYEKVKNAVVYS
jgi:hypothetical protein